MKAQTFAPKRDPSPVTAAAFVKLPLAAPAGAKAKGGWKFSWSDEFDGAALDRTRWGNEIGYVRNSEKQYYTDRTENARIDNGMLLIQGLHDNWNGHEYTSASVSTENKVRLTYGRYEMRAKIDVRQRQLAGLVALEPAGRRRLAQGGRDRHDGVLHRQVPVQRGGRERQVHHPHETDRHARRRSLGQGISRVDDGLDAGQDRPLA